MSFVIPSFNRAQLVGRAVASVLAQEGCESEVVVVDDGSTDGTDAALREIRDPRVTYHRIERGGATRARNHGADLATGSYLVFLDSDDELLPGWGGRFGLILDEKVELVSCDCRRVAVDGSMTTGHAWDLSFVRTGARALFQSGSYAVDRDRFLSVGGFDVELVSGHHTDLCFKLLPHLRDDQFVHISEPLVVHHLGAPHSIRRNEHAVLLGTEQLIQRHSALLTRVPSVLADYHGVAAVSAARLGERKRARAHLRHAAWLTPADGKRWLRLAAAYAPGGQRVWQRRDP